MIMLILAVFNPDIGFYFFIAAIIFGIGGLIFMFLKGFSKDFNRVANENKTKPIELAKEEPKAPEPKWRYLWLQKEDQKLGNTFEKWYKEELTENTEYYRSNKDLREDYYEEKIYKFEPFELPFKREENKVFSYMKEDEWVLVGTIKKDDQEAFKNALESKLCLMPNSYKYVGDNFVKAENNDTYFGLKILENQ